jgi:hypothetical protein
MGVRPKYADCAGRGVDDAAALVRLFNSAGRPTVQVALGK